MSNSIKRIAIIPARSGSKGIKDKNVRPMLGKPLIYYSLKAAEQSGMFDRIFVSTDSKKYAEITRELGYEIPFLRSEDNSSDSASSWDVVKEVLNEFAKRGEKYEQIMLLQPTSPLRTSGDIIKSIELKSEKNARSILSITETSHSPLVTNTLPNDYLMDHFWNDEVVDIPRQQLPCYYRLNGAIYLIDKEELYEEKMFHKDCYGYYMPAIRSVDIDSEIDFILAELILKGRQS